jgi:ammonia channel protein AmtB
VQADVLVARPILVTCTFSFAASLGLLKLTDVVVGLCVSEDAEELGMDLALHGEVGYTPSPRGASGATGRTR